MIVLKVKQIPPIGINDYPALKNVDSGRIYVDTCLGINRYLQANESGFNDYGDYVKFNIPGAWHSFNGEEPDCPLHHDVVFEIQK
jgi:hypothetical protein